MKIAVIYNRESKGVINLFGSPNQEQIGLQTIKRITDALKKGGHTPTAIEGDKDLVEKLGNFMPSVLKGERPGLAFNVSYGIQGQARYTHVPSILEMVGIPYVGSGPLAHSLALDKVVSKMLFRQNGLPTADFAVLDAPDSPLPDLPFPLIVKPKNEAVSFGIRVVHNGVELREAAAVIFDRFQQPVLVEQYIDGREVNVGLLGNGPAEALPPVLLRFGEGPQIYTLEDKKAKAGRRVEAVCPAPIEDELRDKVQQLAVKAFACLGCYDCARVDFRIDQQGQPYILEINSLPSLGEHGSYVEAAEAAGLDYTKLVNRLVECASARYFGTPVAPRIRSKDITPREYVFSYLTERRDKLEERVQELVDIGSRTNDPVGNREIFKRVGERMADLGLEVSESLSRGHAVRTWQTPKGLEGGTLLILHLDVPMRDESAHHGFRRDSEWLYGEGVACSRAPLASVEFALGAVKGLRLTKRARIGVLCFSDEGRDCDVSEDVIRQACQRADRVLVVRPGGERQQLITQRRGLRKYQLIIDGPSMRLGQATKKPDLLRWAYPKLEALSALSSRKQRVAVSVADVRLEAQPMRLPHRARAVVWAGYPDEATASRVEDQIREVLGKQDGCRWELDLLTERPPLASSRENKALVQRLRDIAAEWELDIGEESSLWPSAAGLAPTTAAVVCGVGPMGRHLYTPNEAVQRMSLLQRTLLLAQVLVHYATD